MRRLAAVLLLLATAPVRSSSSGGQDPWRVHAWTTAAGGPPVTLPKT
ncbi:hypothetical protein [Nonomuraea sp. NPDC049784]